MKKSVNKLMAGLGVFAMLAGTLSAGGTAKAENEWSEWSDVATEQSETYLTETREVYRYRDKSTTTSTSSTLEGWIQNGSETTWGSWSAWQDTAVSSGTTRQVNTRTMYRYRDKSTTTSTNSTLSGWTKYDSSTTWGSWSAWQDTAVSASSTRKVETKQVQVTAAYTQYRYGRWNNANNTYWHFCDYLAQQQRGGTWHKAYTPWMNSPLSGTYDGGTCGNHGCYNQANNASQRKFQYNGSNWYWQETQTVPATYKTQYRYQDSKTTYYFYKWGDWTSWSTTQPSSSSNRETQNKTQYQYRDSTTTYSFYKWGDWTEWSTEQPSETADREIETKTQYRYKVIEQPTTQVKVGNVTIVPIETETEDKSVVDNKVKNQNGSKEVKKGDVLTSNKGVYKVTDAKKKTVEYTKPQNKKASTVSIPSEIKIQKKKYKVTSIAANAFRNNKKLKKVVIDKNVKKIGKNAFRGCKKLNSVTIGKNVESIGNHAFYGCKKLNTIEIKTQKLKKVGKAAFKKIAKNPTARVPKGKIQKYKKLFKGKM
ncbi:MAG: leucine-rich repeat domain-containing protein [Clostridium sp.]|nr:leucine-rich repeat domain-containing protein [Clostridium sp.]